jgi:integrase
MGKLKLDEITTQQTAAFISRNSKLSPATVNCGLRTLRRALNLATDWGKLERRPKLSLAKGERQRERIVTEAELAAYMDVCPQPWHDVVTVLYGTAIRPGEAYKFRWEHLVLNGDSGLVQIVEGKSRAARRLLPMTAGVYETLRSRWYTAGRPTVGVSDGLGVRSPRTGECQDTTRPCTKKTGRRFRGIQAMVERPCTRRMP